MGARGCNPFKGIKGFLVFRVPGLVSNFRFFGDVCHSLLGERGADDVSGQVLHGIFISGLDPRATENIESCVTPFIQQRDHILCDLALYQKYLEHLVSEYLLQSFGVNGRRDVKHIVFMKATVGNKDM